jgi:hypothetical protein
MKKLFAILFSILLVKNNFAQNVGIGTSNPAASALLEIKSTNKGVLIPRVSLINAFDNTTIPTPAPNLIVFNTNDALTTGNGMYFNNGTAASPNWEKVGELKLPYYNATSSASNVFTIENYSMSALGNGIKGFSQNGYGIAGSSVAGTGILAYSSAGTAMEINGKLEIKGNGQVPGPGKVLTCDAIGNATWEGAIAFSSTGIQPDGAAEISSGVDKKVAFYTEDYDLGNNYNPSNATPGLPWSTFTAPVKGVYHFDMKICWQNSIETNHGVSLELRSSLNGVVKRHTRSTAEMTSWWLENTISKDLLLEAGEQVYGVASHNSGSNELLFQYGQTTSAPLSYFTGRLVIKL